MIFKEKFIDLQWITGLDVIFGLKMVGCKIVNHKQILISKREEILLNFKAE